LGVNQQSLSRNLKLSVFSRWILPSLILYLQRDRFLGQRLSQKWLIGLQLFRSIGGVFLIEYMLVNIPSNSHTLGIGDLIVALVALSVLFLSWRMKELPENAILLVIVVGVIDFLSAFFLGFTSSESPVQLFFPAIPNQVILFPTGVIPLFLVPYAIFFIRFLRLIN
jgi:hypothetical protein